MLAGFVDIQGFWKNSSILTIQPDIWPDNGYPEKKLAGYPVQP